MKFFKCLSRNVSILQDQEECATKRLSQLSFKQKKKRSGANEKGAPVPNSHRGLKVRFAVEENSRPCSDEAALVKNAQTRMDNPDDLVHLGTHNTTCEPDLESLVPTSDSKMPAKVNLDQTYTVTNPLCQIPDDELDQTTFKIQKFLSSMPACNDVSILKYESEKSMVSFERMYDTDGSQFMDSSRTPLNRCMPKISQTDRQRFLDRFPDSEDSPNNGNIFPRPTSAEVSQSTVNDRAAHFHDIHRLVDFTLSNDRLQPSSQSFACPDLTMQGSPINSPKDGGMDIDVEGLHETVTSIGSGYLNPEAPGSHRLFKDVYGSQVVEKPSPAKHKRLLVTLVLEENGGFGFMLVGECPPKIIVVEKDSPADLAGIKPDDMVIKINNKKMHNSSAESVINFLRTINEPYILMELRRIIKPGVTNNLYGSNLEDESDIEVDDYSQESTIQRDLSAQVAGVSEVSPDSFSQLIFQDSITTDDDWKHKAIHQLVSLEVDFINFMHCGIEKFSRPLRHILSSHQHTTLFQNIEKLVTISEYHFNEMREENASINQEIDDSQCSNHSLFVFLPAFAYESKIHTMCQAYATYIQGFEQSYSLMRELRKNKEFSKFVKEVKRNFISDHLSIIAFIRKPIQHIQELYKTMKEAFATTPKSSPDFVNLQVIQDLLSQCAKPASKLCSPTFRNQDTPSQNSLSCSIAKSDKINVASCVNIQPSEPVKSLNTVRTEHRIVFVSNLRDQQPCLGRQHLIYQGNVYRSNKRGSWVKHELLLFSEMFLLATETSEGSLCVSDSPVYMKDLTGLEISKAHPSEFVLHLRKATTGKVSRKQPYVNPSEENGSTLVLRAASPQDTLLWKSLLQQRVTSVTSRSLNFILFHQSQNLFQQK